MVGILLVFNKTNLKRKFKKLNIFVFCIFACINFEKVDDYFDFFFFLSLLLQFSFLLTTASGKTTFVNILKQVCEDWEVVPEPVARWCNVQNAQGDCEV